MTFYSPLAFLFLLTIPIIIIMYLLKQRHQDFTVSSLYLWQEVIKDLEANAPWQKLKRNILMFLQIAAMALLVLALSHPFLKSVGGKAGNVVVIIDTSMSMQATDTGPSRFDAAKRQAAGFISNLKPGTLVTLISMGSNVIIEENLSSDRSSLLDKLNRLKVTNGVAGKEDAAGLVQSIVKQYPGTSVALFGDEDLKIQDVNIKFYNLGRKGDNYSVTLLSHSQGTDSLTALSRIANYSAANVSLPVSLYVDSKVFDAKNVDIKSGETVNVYWNKLPPDSQLLECRIDKKDCLDADNTAWDSVNPLNTSKVMLVTEQNIFMEKVMALINGVKLYKSSIEDAGALKGYDLYIYDGYIPEKLPTDGNIMVFNPPGNTFFTVENEVELPSVEKSKHELFKYISDYSFSIGKSKLLDTPKWGQAVLQSGEGTLAFCGTLENRRIMVFGFDLHNTDMVLRPVFPILMTNVFEWLIPSRIKNIENIFPGQSIDFNLNPRAQQARVILPSGQAFGIAPPFPAGIFSHTDEIGQYILEQKIPDGSSLHHFTVNAPADKESNLQAAVTAVQGDQSVQPDTKGIVDTGFSLQTIILCLVLILLFTEWWVYSHGI